MAKYRVRIFNDKVDPTKDPVSRKIEYDITDEYIEVYANSPLDAFEEVRKRGKVGVTCWEI